MNELEFFKQHWHKQENFPVKSKEELRNIIKKKSINTLTWVIIVNLLVFFFLVTISLFSNPKDEIIINKNITNFLNLLDYFMFFLPVIFSLIYIYILKKIQVKNSVTVLLKNIITAKRFLNIYIYSYLVILLIIIYIGIYSTLMIDVPHNLNENIYYIILFLSCLFFDSFVLFILWLFYKISYGRLQKKLNENYKILKDLQ